MITTHPDRLLSAAKVLIKIVRLLLKLAILGAGVGAALGIASHLKLGFQLPSEAAAVAPWSSSAALALMIPVLLLALRFFRHLLEIVDSVAEGDPFMPANAERLEQMGWLSLWMALIPLALKLIGIFGDGAALGYKFGFSLPGVIMVLVLFILARVFRHGTAMREELEGTI